MIYLYKEVISIAVSGSLNSDRSYIITQLAAYTTYILPFGGLYATYHLLREPGNSIDYIQILGFFTSKFFTPIPPPCFSPVGKTARHPGFTKLHRSSQGVKLGEGVSGTPRLRKALFWLDISTPICFGEEDLLNLLNCNKKTYHIQIATKKHHIQNRCFIFGNTEQRCWGGDPYALMSRHTYFKRAWEVFDYHTPR